MRRQLKINNLKVMNKDIVKISSAARSARCGMYVLRATTYYYRGVNIFYLLADHHDAAIFRLKKKMRKTQKPRREGTQQEIAGNIAPPAVCPYVRLPRVFMFQLARAKKIVSTTRRFRFPTKKYCMTSYQRPAPPLPKHVT